MDERTRGQLRRRCIRHVYSGARADYGGHICRTPATVEANGKWYCKRHSPDGEAAKKAKDDEKIKAYMAASEARSKERVEQQKRLDAYPKLVDALQLLCAEAGVGVTLADRFQRATELLRELGELPADQIDGDQS